MALQAAGADARRDDPAIVGKDDVGAMPGLDEPQAAIAPEPKSGTLEGGLVEEEHVGAVMAHAAALAEQQFHDQGRDGPLLRPLLQPLLCVPGEVDVRGSMTDV